MARPLKRTDDIRDKVIAALKAGSTRKRASELAGFTDEYLRRWMKEDEDFAQEVVQAEAFAVVRNECIVRRAAEDGDWRAAAFWLERRQRSDYGKSVAVTVTEVSSTQLDLSALTDDDLKQLESILERVRVAEPETSAGGEV